MKYTDNSFVVSPLLIFAFFTIVCCSCNRESSETELTYPATFIYEKLDFKKSRVFVLNTTNYDEIVPTGNFKILDSIIQLYKYLDIDQTQFPIQKIECLDTQLANLSFFPLLGDPNGLQVSYSFEQKVLAFPTANSVIDTLPIQLADDKTSMVFDIMATTYSYKQNGSVEYAALEIDYDNPAIASFIAKKRQKNNLKAGDTIALNVSGYLYRKQ